ncbi:unnamed protein product [Sphagnum compactum]
MRKASCLFCFMFLLFLHQSFNTVVAQPGFISLDCGGDQEYTDSNNITWIPDNTSFVQTGSVATLPTANNQSSIPQSLTRLRYFPNNQSKNCYTLPANLSTRYLIRATFLYGNYDGATTNPIFDISLDATIWATITILNATETYYQEIVAIAQSRSSTFSVCLLNVNQGTPFLSSLELRPLFGSIYELSYLSAAYLSSMLRINFGAPSFASVRYPYDPVDRIWMSDQAALAETTSLLQNVGSNVTSISTTRSVRITSASDRPPQLVMQTAAVGNNGILSYRSRLNGFPSQAYAVSYFAEIQVLKPTDIRSFIFNTNIADPTFVDQNLNLQQDANGPFIAFEPGYLNVTIPQYADYSLTRTPNSTLNPIINALEIYKIVTKVSTTNYADVLALSSLASQLPPQHSQGDPCLPVAWDWVSCNNASSPQVTTIALSNRSLSGTIPNSLATMTALQSISLDYNNFTGPIPDLSSLSSLQFLNLEDNDLSGDFPQWLANLPGLTVLWVDNNNLTGSVPQSLLNRAGLQTRFYDNPFLCTNTSCMTNLPKSHTNVVAVVAGVVGGVLALFLVLGAVGTCFYCRHIQQLPKGGSTKITETSFDQARYFQLPELKAATNNFTTKIGEGGFGPVYYGKTKENQEIAVKVLAGDSRQGAREFTNEVTLLSRVHHRNLVAMIGYCQHAKDRILVYEYMPNGSLHDCLHGPSAVSDPLDWMTRLNIAHDAAKGLEYLHTGCSPGIIHRDVKSSNILLTNKMVAKVSDFGLSKLTSDEFTHISSTIQGTIGYLDPEYYQLQQLTMKSDVYSFGVVLLELISGREPISPKQIDFSLVTWARGLLQRGDIESIVDPALGQFYSSESMWKFAELAISCVEPSSFHRPAMCDVFQGILEAIKLETGMSMNASDPRSKAASLATCAISPGYFDNDYLGGEGGYPIMSVDLRKSFVEPTLR